MMMATPGLVVGAQQGRAVGGNQSSAAEQFQLGVVGHADHPGFVARQHDVAAGVALDHLRTDVRAGGFRRGVHDGSTKQSSAPGDTFAAGIVPITIPC